MSQPLIWLRSRTLGTLIVAAGVMAAMPPTHAQRSYIKGVFVATPEGTPVELIAWAEMGPPGQLGMVGSIEDVPTVSSVTGFLCSLPLWKPIGIVLASDAIFRDHRAERRQLRFAARPLNIYTLELRVAELERRSTIDRLLRDVKASGGRPGYVFVILASTGLVRYYPVRLDPAGAATPNPGARSNPSSECTGRSGDQGGLSHSLISLNSPSILEVQ